MTRFDLDVGYIRNNNDWGSTMAPMHCERVRYHCAKALTLIHNWKMNHVLVIMLGLLWDWPEWDVVAVKHLSHADQLSRVLMGRIQNHHLSEQQAHAVKLFAEFRSMWGLHCELLMSEGNCDIKQCLHSTCDTHQIMEILADLSNDSRKGGPE